MDYWVKQAHGKPLFEDIEWSKPQNRNTAGKLLIIGGNLHGFAAVGEAYQAAVGAGVGSIRLLLPDSLKKTVGQSLLEAEFAPSTPSGAFSQKALEPALSLVEWADGVLLAGDIGKSSETAIFLEKLAAKYGGKLTITKDALDFFTKNSEQLLSRPETLLVGSVAQIQKLGLQSKPPSLIKFEMELMQLVQAAHQLSENTHSFFITYHHSNLLVACDGRVSTTKGDENEDVWRVKTASRAAVYWLQNPSKTFEAITSSAYHPEQ